MRLLKELIKKEKGQALPMALVLLLFGGFFVVPCLGLMSTSLRANRVVDEATLGNYAADSGVEDALRQLKYTPAGPPPSYTLGQNVNSMGVQIVAESEGEYTLVATEWVQISGPCWERVQVSTQMGTEPIEGNVYEYTITVHASEGGGGECGGHISLEELGTLLPAGYSYVGGSAALHPGENQLSITNPQEIVWDESAGAWILRWTWGGSGKQLTLNSPHQNDPVTRYQQFHVTGTGDHEGFYSWVEATRQNIGTVGELSGTLYTITSTARLSGATTAIVAAKVLKVGGESPYDMKIISWQISK